MSSLANTTNNAPGAEQFQRQYTCQEGIYENYEGLNWNNYNQY